MKRTIKKLKENLLNEKNLEEQYYIESKLKEVIQKEFLKLDKDKQKLLKDALLKLYGENK